MLTGVNSATIRERSSTKAITQAPLGGPYLLIGSGSKIKGASGYFICKMAQFCCKHGTQHLLAHSSEPRKLSVSISEQRWQRVSRTIVGSSR
jgi:hypothetical protein